jgi:hypothetical protein
VCVFGTLSECIDPISKGPPPPLVCSNLVMNFTDCLSLLLSYPVSLLFSVLLNFHLLPMYATLLFRPYEAYLHIAFVCLCYLSYSKSFYVLIKMCFVEY